MQGMDGEWTFKVWFKAMREDLLDLKITDRLWEDYVAWGGRNHVVEPNKVGNNELR